MQRKILLCRYSPGHLVSHLIHFTYLEGQLESQAFLFSISFFLQFHPTSCLLFLKLHFTVATNVT